MKPIPGAAAVVLHRGRLLLVQRRNPPDAGAWSFPGGHVEAGETDSEAAIRELLEETGIAARPRRTLTVLDVGDERRRFRLAMVQCDFVSGALLARDDALDAAWVAIADVRCPDRRLSDSVQAVLDLAMAP